MKNIVCLDGYTLNPGDNPWDAVAEQGNFTCYERSLGGVQQVHKRAKDAHILLTNKTRIDRALIDVCKQLECIVVMATGYNVVDYQYAQTKGIPVLNVPAYGTDTVAEMTFALIFSLARSVEINSQDVKNNLGWSNSLDWTYWLSPQMELAGKTIGIIGFGHIGRRVAEIAKVFRMQVLVYSRSGAAESYEQYQSVALDTLLSQSDIVSLHCPVFAETENMMDASKLALMKRDAFLVNTARGQLVVEKDLADALNHGVIAGAGLDTMQQEPPELNNPLLTAKNCVITPHIAWATLEARQRIMAILASNIRNFINGKPENVVR